MCSGKQMSRNQESTSICMLQSSISKVLPDNLLSQQPAFQCSQQSWRCAQKETGVLALESLDIISGYSSLYYPCPSLLDLLQQVHLIPLTSDEECSHIGQPWD